MNAVTQARETLGTKDACEALGVPRASYHRAQHPPQFGPRLRRPPRKLSTREETTVLDTLHSERFVDSAPEEVVATLLDEGQYLCSPRTMYRVLERHDEVRERRRQLSRPSYQRPELMATRPNHLWSWDITKLLSQVKWTYFYLYVVMDVFSRYVVGWMVADRESADLAKTLFAETAERQGVQPGQLTAHADNGAAMSSQVLAQFFANLGLTKTHSRPYVSNDNPFSEAQFKTLKYMPDFPNRFTNQDHATSHMRVFFPWYNFEHRHSGIGMYTPADVHFGRADARHLARAQVLEAAYRLHPERFPGGCPAPQPVPTAVYINPPQPLPAMTRPLVAAEPGHGVGGVTPVSNPGEEVVQ